MRQLILSIVLVFSFGFLASAAVGLIKVKSQHSVTETADRLEKALKSKGMTIFSQIDHAAGAKAVGKDLRPTVLVIFGSPKVGTPLMQCQQTIGIDLPQKALIWEDQDSNVWFTYNDPEYLIDRHQSKNCRELVGKIKQALANFAKIATSP